MSLHADATAVLSAHEPSCATQQQLRSDYLAALAARPDALSRQCAPAHLTAGAAVIDSTGTRTLLVHHPKVGLWLQPGGHCEPTDATLADVALREAREETGIAELRIVGGPVLLDRHRAPCGVEHHLDVMFAAVAPPDAVPVRSAESIDVRWFDTEMLLADELPEPTDDAVRTLVRLALDRVRSG